MFGRRRPQSDFSDELQAHLQLEMDRLRAEGLGEEEAYRMARRSVGNLGKAGERFYESTRWLWLESLVQDTRVGLRRLRKAPVFTATTILTLALGIGATTSVFTLVHAVLLKSLPVSNPKDLYRLGRTTHCCDWGGYSQYQEFSIVSYELYRHFRDNTKGFAELAAFQAGQSLFGVRREGHAEPAQSYPGEFVSGNYFDMFGVTAYAGRVLTRSDERSGAQPVAVMSYRLWQEKYGSDRSVIGGGFSLNQKPFTIVGIAPPSFFGDSLRSSTPDFFLPLAMEPLVQGESSLLHRPANHWLDLIGRIEPGADPVAIQAQMRVELQGWLQSHRAEISSNDARTVLPKQTLYLSPGGAGITQMRQDYEHWLQILMIAAGMVLAIVCANVANLMLVRGMEQRQQTSLSVALGAHASRLVRQALTESILLSLLGGAAGVAIAYGGTRLILHSAFSTVAGLGGVPISASPSLPVLAFAFCVSMVTGVLFGSAPAWVATRVDPIEALRGANRSTSRTGSLPRKTLVVLQAALSLVLLSASGLLTATLSSLEHQKFGFEQDGRTVLNIDPLLAGYKAKQLTPLYRRIHDSLTSIPGVSSVALCIYSPFSGDFWNGGIVVAGHLPPGPQDDDIAGSDRVTPGYFDVTGNRVIKGRGITEEDTATSRHVAVVNEAFVRKFLKHDNPIGTHFGSGLETAREYEIVGVAEDARYPSFDLDKPVDAFFFLAESQYTIFPKKEDTEGEVRSHYLHDVVVKMQPGRTLSDAEARKAIAAVDSNLPVNYIRRLRDQVAGQFGQSRLIARVTSLFGILSLIVASIGLYGVTAYNAGRRTNEIGIRMALGAQRGDVVRLILQGGIWLILFGMLIGVPLTIAAGRALGDLLYGLSPYDPIVTLESVLVLGVSAAVACWIPALRASSISPLRALRAE